MEGLKAELARLARAAVNDCEAGPRTAAAVDAWWSTLEGPARSVELVAAGKAAASMTMAALEVLGDARGLAVTKDQHHHGFVADQVELRFAAHPTPDARSEAAGKAIEARLRRVPASGRVVALWSGGASSLLSAPVPGLTLAEVVATTERLLAGGCAIEEINAVRKQILRATGGRLAAATRAPIDVFVISDVLGDDVTTIGSGPFAHDESLALAKEVVGRVEVPDAVHALIAAAERRAIDVDHVTHHLIASVETLMDAASTRAEAAGWNVRRLPPAGEPMGATMSRLEEAARGLRPGELLVTGGEPTMVLPDDHGRGGRAQHLALLMSEALAGESDLAFLAAGSDGTDGPTPAAGAVVDGASWSAWGASAPAARDRCDAFPLLDEAGLTLTWGGTGTNVLDLHLLARARN